MLAQPLALLSMLVLRDETALNNHPKMETV